MKKKFMYICLTTGLFSSGILVNNLNAGNYTAEQVSELKSTLEDINNNINNFDKIFSSCTYSKTENEYHDKIKDFVNNTFIKFLNLEATDEIKNVGDLIMVCLNGQGNEKCTSKYTKIGLMTKIIKKLDYNSLYINEASSNGIEIVVDDNKMKVKFEKSNNNNNALNLTIIYYQKGGHDMTFYEFNISKDNNNWRIDGNIICTGYNPLIGYDPIKDRYDSPPIPAPTLRDISRQKKIRDSIKNR